jgi:hypothetical protein
MLMWLGGGERRVANPKVSRLRRGAAWKADPASTRMGSATFYTAGSATRAGRGPPPLNGQIRTTQPESMRTAQERLHRCYFSPGAMCHLSMQQARSIHRA